MKKILVANLRSYVSERKARSLISCETSSQNKDGKKNFLKSGLYQKGKNSLGFEVINFCYIIVASLGLICLK